jgi:dihydroorotate dehydrogenase electron transfer subunit
MAVYRELGRAVGAASAASPRIEILYRVVGRGTTLLSEARPGQSISLLGPLGHGFPIEPSAAPALLVGGGTGSASLFELAKALAALGRPVSVLLGAASEPDLIGLRDFACLDVELVCATEDGSRGYQGLVTEPLAERLAASAPGSAVFACGPSPMMRAVAELAEAQGAPCFVSLENPMACGFGVCLGCAVPRREGGFSLVCRDGPVFEAGEIDWEGLP